MAWELRHNRYRYYYRKRRIRGRVISEYIGDGPRALLSELLDQEARGEAQELRRELDRLVEQDTEIDLFLDLSVNLAKAMLLLAGCYSHKGEWRRRRGKITE